MPSAAQVVSTLNLVTYRHGGCREYIDVQSGNRHIDNLTDKHKRENEASVCASGALTTSKVGGKTMTDGAVGATLRSVAGWLAVADVNYARGTGAPVAEEEEKQGGIRVARGLPALPPFPVISNYNKPTIFVELKTHLADVWVDCGKGSVAAGVAHTQAAVRDIDRVMMVYRNNVDGSVEDMSKAITYITSDTLHLTVKKDKTTNTFNGRSTAHVALVRWAVHWAEYLYNIKAREGWLSKDTFRSFPMAPVTRLAFVKMFQWWLILWRRDVLLCIETTPLTAVVDWRVSVDDIICQVGYFFWSCLDGRKEYSHAQGVCLSYHAAWQISRVCHTLPTIACLIHVKCMREPTQTFIDAARDKFRRHGCDPLHEIGATGYNRHTCSVDTTVAVGNDGYNTWITSMDCDRHATERARSVFWPDRE